MLKPKYGNLAESVSDFTRILQGMNKTSPVEHTSYDEMDMLVREEQELERLEREILHVENVLAGSGMEISESERKELSRQYGRASQKFDDAANRAAGRAKTAGRRGMNPALQARFKEMETRLRRKGRSYKDKTEQIAAKPGIVSESRDPAHLSQYRSVGTSIQSFRVLAGLDEQTPMPRDAGIFGSTRHNANFDEMVKPLGEGAQGRKPHESVHDVLEKILNR